MKQLLLSALVLSLLTTTTFAQALNPAINKDSLLQVILKHLPENKVAQFKEVYNTSGEQGKELLLIMTLPISSKKELIANIDSNMNNINTLKTEYARLVPKNYLVTIECKPEDKILSTKAAIDLRIIHDTAGKTKVIKQEWNLDYNSPKLEAMIQSINWTMDTVYKIKKLLEDANCIRIENGETTTIGFARSGMGMYAFKLFNADLTQDQIKKYNNGCRFIYYKKNIVLEYGGGAVGPQCFPD